MSGKNFKKEKYKEQLQNEINSYLRKLGAPGLQFVSITSVELTSDYSYATLMWDTFDSNKRGDAKKAIEGALGKIRSHLAKTLKVRQVPYLKLKYDSQYESELEISRLLDEEARQGKF